MRNLKDHLDLCAINTATLGHRSDITSVIDDIARAGYGGICPWRRDLQNEDIPSVARRIRDAGLRLTGYCRSTYIPASSKTQFLANIEDNKRAIEDCVELEAPCFVMVVGSLPTGSKDLLDARAQLHNGMAMLLEHAQKVGARLALEPLHPMYAGDRSCLSSLEQALDLAEVLEPAPGPEPTLGIAADVYHIWWDPKLEQQIQRAGRVSRIFGFHVCDWLVPTADMLLDRGMMGDGVIDIPRIRALAEDAGYDGLVEVEIFSEHNWWQRPQSEVLKIAAERLQSAC